MKFKNLILTMAITLAVPAFIVGCDKNDGPMEKAGKEIDNAVEKTGEAIEDTGGKVMEEAGKEMDNAVEKTGEAIEDMGDKVKESVN